MWKKSLLSPLGFTVLEFGSLTDRYRQENYFFEVHLFIRFHKFFVVLRYVDNHTRST